MIRLYAWWSAMGRQKRVGWTFIILSIVYVAWFLKARLFEIGPEISRREWFSFAMMIVLFMIGTINVRMAEMRERHQQIMSPGDFDRSDRR